MVSPAVRSASNLPVLGSRIPSVSHTAVRASGLPRATCITMGPSQPSPHTATPPTSTTRIPNSNNNTTDTHTATVTDLLVEGAELSKQANGPSGHPRRTGPISASPLTSRNPRAGTNANTPAVSTTSSSAKPSGLRVPSALGAHRSAMTCPPSASSRSLASSRSASTTGSINNLTSTTQAHRAQAVSAQSVCAALNKRERSIAIAKPMVRPQPTGTSHTAKPPSLSTTSIPSSVAHSMTPISTTKSRIGSGGIPMSNTALSSTLTNGCTVSSEAPKPIRGGRKSLTGRKPDSRQVPNNVQVKAVCKPKPVLNHVEPIENGIGAPTPAGQTTASTSSNSSSSSPYNTTRSAKSVKHGLENKNADVDSFSNGIVTDSNQGNANGMWIVRGELGVVNGLK
ncbi:unnamed protein product [Echinostoma caproni]|uniref:Uncharacterized protein n=1 Tax=Echinostoma caproni TaxID=27848 RepID=A0A3P8HE76_9TREM|nr:unnamed protein product [Echinostoma caproni]